MSAQPPSRSPGRPSVAVVGAGIAGLAAAYRLREHAEVTVFDREARAGGHANTIEVEDNGRVLGIDTAFVVFNEPSYPNMTTFFSELDVPTLRHQGGFLFFDLDTGLRFGTQELGLPEEELRGTYDEELLTIHREARRFHREGRRDFLRKRTDMPLGEYLDRNGYSEAFRYGYVILLATAVWSVPAELVWEMPTTTVIAFFMAHDEAGLGGAGVDWRTVEGGSITYVRKALAAIDAKLRLGDEVLAIHEEADQVVISTAAGVAYFDYVVCAVHGDQARELLTEPTDIQQRVLAKIRYNQSLAVLHTDTSVLPADRARWENWNYGKLRVAGETRPYVAYYMNRLHQLDTERDYLVTLDYPGELDEARIIRELPYSHPVIDMDLRRLQEHIYQVNVGGRVKLCGSYFHSKRLHWDQIGSHEAAFSAGTEAAAQLLRELGVS
ncbi:NAD(P)/FAD-dependent oxidoreductase [Streptomyces sp. PT12]|uniref:NAD(P)/FAD-dependent oxidoreductase n=1 Tax=Streptomyces sp. PT12 TaxID=1510197 RepID=UPI000DE54D22|nr:FAD-dependent oxidoreductase [Streptomyces sp. PT12]RBM20680.1 amine oxidase [Streptomyces sp. PT12]